MMENVTSDEASFDANGTLNNETAVVHSVAYFRAICCIIFAVVGIPGNLLTILAILRTPKLRNVTSAFIINLCFSDAFYCGFTAPITAARIFRLFPFPYPLCYATLLIGYTNVALSLLTVVAITINRYFLIVHPRRYVKLCTKLSTGIYIASLWIIAFVIVSPTAAGVWGTFHLDTKRLKCRIQKVNGKSSELFFYWMTFGVPSVVLIFCYARILIVVRKSQRKMECGRGLDIQENETQSSWFSILFFFRNQKGENEDSLKNRSKRNITAELRILRIVLVIFLSYVICFFPLSLLYLLQKQESHPVLTEIGYIGVAFSAIVNPIVYAVMSKEYREAYKNLWCFPSFNRNATSQAISQ